MSGIDLSAGDRFVRGRGESEANTWRSTGVIPIIDTHVHFYDRTPAGPPGVVWRWLDDDYIHPTLGHIEGIKGRRFGPIELHAESRMSAVAGVVHIQAASGTPDPVSETNWIDALARSSRPPILGIVAEVRLEAEGAEEVLRQHAASSLLRGIRDFGASNLDDRSFRMGYSRLSKWNLTFDWHGLWSDATSVIRLARRYPDVRVVVEHCANPPLQDPEAMSVWRESMRALAAEDNVAVKLSGWGMSNRLWSAPQAMACVTTCVELFGAQRCMFGSNWPFGRLSGSYGDHLSVIEEVAKQLTPDESADVSYRTAMTWYRLPPAGMPAHA